MAVLPEWIAPMLAKNGAPFDSKEHFFEVKWDGVRALTFTERDGHRMQGRRRKGLEERYPELSLAAIPDGVVLDGELVVLGEDGRPDFRAAVGREQASSRQRISALARSTPITYVVFDLLYRDFQPITAEPLSIRRELLGEILAAANDPRLVLSDGVAEHGRELFDTVQARHLEGIMAKRLDSRYRPGERSEAWLKIKPVRYMHCAILGFEPAGADDIKSLVIATDDPDGLRCVGKVGSGLTDAMRRRLNHLLRLRLRAEPLIPMPGIVGLWVEPGLYCSVSYLERTESGALRAPVFQDLIDT